jgi:hypothetical protein
VPDGLNAGERAVVALLNETIYIVLNLKEFSLKKNLLRLHLWSGYANRLCLNFQNVQSCLLKLSNLSVIL